MDHQTQKSDDGKLTRAENKRHRRRFSNYVADENNISLIFFINVYADIYCYASLSLGVYLWLYVRVRVGVFMPLRSHSLEPGSRGMISPGSLSPSRLSVLDKIGNNYMIKKMTRLTGTSCIINVFL